MDVIVTPGGLRWRARTSGAAATAGPKTATIGHPAHDIAADALLAHLVAAHMCPRSTIEGGTRSFLGTAHYCDHAHTAGSA